MLLDGFCNQMKRVITRDSFRQCNDRVYWPESDLDLSVASIKAVVLLCFFTSIAQLFTLSNKDMLILPVGFL